MDIRHPWIPLGRPELILPGSNSRSWTPNHLSPANVMGRGQALYGTGPGALYGTGPSHTLGLLPGQHSIPMEHMHQAIHNYKSRNGLHMGPKHNLMLPASHVLSILEHAAHGHETNPHGGFLPMLPLALGAALPFISGAVGHLLGGFAKRGGEHLADAIRGQGVQARMYAGIPQISVDHGGRRHLTVHGAGIGDLFKRLIHHMRRLISSAPARQFGTQALGALHEAAQHAITDRLGKVHEAAAERLKRLQTMPEEEPTLTDTSGGPMEAQDTVNPDYADEEANAEQLTGSGRRRRKRAPPKGRGMPTAKRGRKVKGGNLLGTVGRLAAIANPFQVPFIR